MNVEYTVVVSNSTDTLEMMVNACGMKTAIENGFA
jgi:hypothetical protein